MATILVVDDEEPIRQLVTRVLEKKGHTVISFGTAREALAVTTPIDLLLVDFILPELNGRDLTEALRKRRADLPVILMSGYLPQRNLLPDQPSIFLQKPMLPSAVVQAVDNLLGIKN
jgi:CheY-like chemotaxis protein